MFVAYLNSNNSFNAFNKDILIKLTHFCPNDLSSIDLMILKSQLETYIMDVRSNTQFSSPKDIESLTELMTQSKKVILYLFLFKLLKLALFCPLS